MSEERRPIGDTNQLQSFHFEPSSERDMSRYNRKPNFNNMRATSHTPPARGAFQHPEDSPLVMDLRLQLKDVQRAYQEQLHINAKQKHRVRELEAATQVPREVQLSLEENPLVKDLRRQLQGQKYVNDKLQTRLRELEEVQEKKALEKKVEELQKELNEAQEEKATIMEFGKFLLKQKDEEREQMIEQGRQRVNDYVQGLYEENDNLKRFSQEQQTLALRYQAKVQELEEQLETQKANSHGYSADIFKELERTRDTVRKQKASMMKMSQKLDLCEAEKRALESTLQKTTEEAQKKDKLLVRTRQELQREQEEKQALQRRITVLESALTEQRRTAEEALSAQVLSLESAIAAERQTAEEALNKQLLSLESAHAAERRAAEEAWNKQVLSLESALTEQRQRAADAQDKAQKLEESLNIERSKVQKLQKDLDTEKKTFMAVLEKCHATHTALVEENSLHQKTIKELSTALTHSEEERTSALLRCDELQTSLKESEDQLWQNKAIVEELQAEVEKKNKKKKRRWFTCWQ